MFVFYGFKNKTMLSHYRRLTSLNLFSLYDWLFEDAIKQEQYVTYLNPLEGIKVQGLQTRPFKQDVTCKCF